MPLETQLLELNVASGLAQQIDPRLLPNGTWAQLDNMLQSRNGSAEKRLGYQQLPIQVYPNSPVEFLPSVVDVLDTRGDEWRAYGEHTDGLFWSWSWSESAERWVRKDTVSQCSVEVQPVGSSYVASWLPQSGVSAAGRVATGWMLVGDPTTLTLPYQWVARVEDESGAVVLDDTVLANIAGTARFVQIVVGESLILLYTDGTAANNLYSRVVDLATGAIGAATLQIALGIGRFHAVAYDATHYLIAWYDLAAPVQVTVQRRTIAGAIVAGVVQAVAGVPTQIAIDCSASAVSLAVYENGVGVSTTVYDLALALVWGPTMQGVGADLVLAIGTCIDDAGIAATTRSYFAGAATPVHGDTYTFDVAGAIAVACQHFNTQAIAQPWRENGRTLVALWQGDATGLTSAPSIAMVCAADSEVYVIPVAVLSHLAQPDAVAFSVIGTALPRPPLRSSGAREIVLSLVADSVTFRGVGRALCSFERRQSALLWAAEQRDCTAHSGGFTGWGDGTGEVEIGTLAPVIRLGVAGAGNIANGTYLYSATWEWFDEAGNKHESEPSDQISLVVAAGPVGQTIDFETLALTRKGDLTNGARRNMRAVLYRTDASGTVFKRITAPALGTLAGVTNDKGVATITITDQLSDAQLDALGYGLLYTSGAIVPNVVAPPARAIVSHRNRLWIASGEDTRELWYSKLIVPGEAPGFSQFLTLRVDDANDGVTALGSLDDKLIVFTRDRIYYVSGDGPNDTAAGGVFNGPFRLPTDFGCSDQRSVVMYPDGILFWNGSGIYKLDRSLQVSFVGEPVVDETTGADAVIAKLDPVDSRVWFLIFTTSGSFSRFAVFDYRVSVWTTETVYGETGGGESPILVTAHHWHGGLHRIGQESTTEGVCEQGYGTTPGYDLEAYFPATIETPWIHVAGVNGFQRVRRVWITGEQLAAHKLTVQIFTDYNDGTVRQEVTFNVDVGSPMLGLPRERLAVHVLPQQCSAIKIRVFDSAPDDPVLGLPTGYNIVAITLEMGVKGGYKLPAVNRAGG